MDKKCTKCKEVKSLDEFNKQKTSKDNLQPYCKECCRIVSKKYREENREHYREYNKKWAKNNPDNIRTRARRYRENNPEKIKESNKKWRTNNPEKHRENHRKWKENNREKVRARNKEWAQKNKEWFQEYQQEYYQSNKKKIIQRNRERSYNDPAYKLRNTVRCQINKTLRDGKGGESILQYVDWSSYEELKKHLENQFQEGMTWDNHAIDGWHIDHIIPQSVLLDGVDSMGHPNFRKCWALENLQPLWAFDNLIKGSKILDEE